jgi:hypothetical protein
MQSHGPISSYTALARYASGGLRLPGGTPRPVPNQSLGKKRLFFLRSPMWWSTRDLNPTDILPAEQTATPSSPVPRKLKMVDRMGDAPICAALQGQPVPATRPVDSFPRSMVWVVGPAPTISAFQGRRITNFPTPSPKTEVYKYGGFLLRLFRRSHLSYQTP